MRRPRSILASAAGTVLAAAATVPFAGSADAAVTVQKAVPEPALLAPEAQQVAPARPAGYRVRPGDTVWAVAERFCGTGDAYPSVAAASGLRNANEIFPGELLRIACHAAARAVTRRSSASRSVSRAVRVTSVSGTLGCGGLEALWKEAGGSRAAAFTAAEVAMAESGGRQFAHSPTNDFGYWQINGSHGPAMATYNALGNARAAVAISGNGRNWSPWTTWREGLERGRC